MDNQKCTIADHMHDECHVRCVSWRSIFTGALIGVGLSFLLNLFSIAIGLTAFNTTKEGLTVFAVGGFIGIAIGSIISMFMAGWVAGFLGRPYCAKRHLGVLYGFTTWCLGLVFLVALSTPLTKFIASYSAYINHGATVAQVAPSGDVIERPAVMSAEETEKAANDAGKAALAVFALFFFGAFASCLGGHSGMNACRKEDVGMNPNSRI